LVEFSIFSALEGEINAANTHITTRVRVSSVSLTFFIGLAA
jgi:hypothetical protein